MSATRIEHHERPTPELIRLLEQVPFGDSGLRYRRRNVAQALGSLNEASYFSLYDDDRLRAAYALLPGRATLGGVRVASYYRALLAVDPDVQRRGYGRQIVGAAFDAIAERHREPTLAWGLIERHNHASRGLLESMGAVPAGSVHTFLVYRQWPRSAAGLRELDGQALKAYAEALDATNSGRGLVVRAPTGLPAYGLFVGNTLAAAARIGSTVLDLGPGDAVARLLHRYAYSRFGAIGRRYNRRAFTYTTIHDPLIVPQYADRWKPFLSAVLARTGTHMASFTLDPASDANTLLDAAGLFGRFAKRSRKELLLYTRAWHVDGDLLGRLGKGPFEGGPAM